MRIWWAVVVLSSALSIVAMAQPTSPPLKLVSTAWPPFTNATGQTRFALDLVEAALGRFGVTAKTTIVDAGQFTPSLLGAEYDGSAAAWRDADRERVLIFSQPYLENRLVLVGRHGADVSAKTLGDIKGKRVAIVEGYSYGETIDATGPMFVRSRSEEDSLTQLLNGTVDYTLMDALVIHYIVSNYPEEAGKKLQIGEAALVRRDLYLAVTRRRADAESIVARFNTQLRRMVADRTYHRLLHVDWIKADVDGDGIPEYVPVTDHPGPSQPTHVYSLFTTPLTDATTHDVKSGFYVGGNIYSNWASVPASYKEVNPDYPDSRRSTGSVFTFRW
jgi:polar amino acid transport system substrate-binding protein